MNPDHKQRLPKVICLIVVSALAGGSVAPFAKVALEVFRPFTLVLIRFLSASLVLLPFVYRCGELNRKTLEELLWVALVGSLNPVLLFIALQFTPSSVSPLIYAAVPLMTVLYLHHFRGQKIAADKILGIGVGFSGVAMIILLPFFQQGKLDVNSLWGNLLILGAAISFMLYGVLSKDKQQQYQISPLALTFYFSFVTLALSVPFAAAELIQEPVDLAAVRPKHILSGLEVGVVGTSLFYLAYQEAIKAGNELSASLFTYLQPIATILFAVILLDEAITPPFVIGGSLAVIGAQLASGRRT